MKSGRILLIIGVLLTIFAIILYATWQMVYILKFYREEIVYEGFGDKKDSNNYHKI